MATNLNLQNSVIDRQGVNGQLTMTEPNKKKTLLTKDFANLNAPALLIRSALSPLSILKLHLPLAHTNSV